MKRSKKCFDLSGLEDEHRHDDTKRYRTDSEQTDLSTDTDLSEMSENFQKSAVISTPFQSSKSVAFPSPPLSLDMIGCKFDFEPEDYAFGSSFGSSTKSKGSSLGGFARKFDHQ